MSEISQEHSKTCVICGVTKPLSDFITNKLHYSSQAPTICAKCRAKLVQEDEGGSGGKGAKHKLSITERLEAAQIKEDASLEAKEAHEEKETEQSEKEAKDTDKDSDKESDAEAQESTEAEDASTAETETDVKARDALERATTDFFSAETVESVAQANQQTEKQTAQQTSEKGQQQQSNTEQSSQQTTRNQQQTQSTQTQTQQTQNAAQQQNVNPNLASNYGTSGTAVTAAKNTQVKITGGIAGSIFARQKAKSGNSSTAKASQNSEKSKAQSVNRTSMYQETKANNAKSATPPSRSSGFSAGK